GFVHAGTYIARSGTIKWRFVSAGCFLWSAARISRPNSGQHDRMEKLRASAAWHSGLQFVRGTSRTDAGDAGRSRRADCRSSGYGRALLHVYLDALSRSEEHTSELQSPYDLVCRLLL